MDNLREKPADTEGLSALYENGGEVVLLACTAGKRDDGIVERLQDGVGRESSQGADYFFEVDGAKLFLIGILPFNKAIGDQKEEVARFKVKRSGWGGSKLGKNAERDSLRIDFGENICGRGVAQERSMAGGEDFEIASAGSASDSNEGDKTAGIKIARDGIVNGCESAENGFVGAKIGA